MWSWNRYVPAAEKKKKAAKIIKEANKKGQIMSPVNIEGRTIAKTFWGSAWCEHLELYCDFENRLPRGRTYVRNGSVIDLQVFEGRIAARVMGSELYHVSISIQPMINTRWKALIKTCAGKIDSLIELLQGKLSAAVMAEIIKPETGLFPSLKEISTDCSCPDFSQLCKHRAAVLYGIGARLDTAPEILFTLRHVNPTELIASTATDSLFPCSSSSGSLEESNLSALFGIEMVPDQEKSQQASPALIVTQQQQISEVLKQQEIKPSKNGKGSKGSSKAAKSSNKININSKKPSTHENVDLTIPQAALMLQISSSKLTQLLNAKVIPSTGMGKQRHVSFQAILEYRKLRQKI